MHTPDNATSQQSVTSTPLDRATYFVRELIGLIREYNAGPCHSLRQRMHVGTLRAERFLAEEADKSAKAADDAPSPDGKQVNGNDILMLIGDASRLRLQGDQSTARRLMGLADRLSVTIGDAEACQRVRATQAMWDADDTGSARHGDPSPQPRAPRSR